MYLPLPNRPDWAAPHDLFIAPEGNDDWTGFQPVSDGRGLHGPMRTLSGALRQIRQRRSRGELAGPLTIWLNDGVYRLTRPLELHGPDADLAFAAAPGAAPVIDGGVLISGWQEDRFAGQTAWSVDVALHLDSRGPWRSLFVNGRRAEPARYPAEGWLFMESVPGRTLVDDLFAGTDRFIAKPGDLDGVELVGAEVVVAHFWVDERMPVASYDPTSRLLVSERTAIFRLTDSFHGRFAKYCVENTAAGLLRPGQWFLDRQAKRLWYIPLPGETLTTVEVTVPVLTQFIRLVGTVDAPVRNVSLRGLTFRHADWQVPDQLGVFWDPLAPAHTWTPRASYVHLNECLSDLVPRRYASGPQAALDVPGALHLRHAHACTIDGCTIQRVGFFGVGLHDGCQHDRILRCTFEDTGAGAVNADGAGLDEDIRRRTGWLTISDNHILHTGKVFRASVAVLSAHAAHVRIVHNLIEHVSYSAISVGWQWSYAANPSHDNLIAWNRIRHLAETSGMADLGGIYTLGAQPGTMIRCNIISDVADSAYGGWGIYLDQGSAFIIVEDNLVARCSSNAVHEHWGRQNIFRNNIFVDCGKPGAGSPLAISYQVAERWLDHPPRLTTVERNIIITKGTPVYANGDGYLADPTLRSDLNVAWDRSGTAPLWFLDDLMAHLRTVNSPPRTEHTLASFQALGYDRLSCTADPLISGLESDRPVLAPGSPALASGFVMPDWSLVGPRRV